MSDTALNTIYQYGPTADRLAFTPNPAAGSKLLYTWYDTDETNLYAWDGSNWILVGGSTSSGLNQLTGDVTAGPGINSQVATLAASGVAAATYGDSTHVAAVTVDAKGRITTASNVAISGVGTAVTSLTGDVTGTGPGATATTIPNDTVTYAKMQNVSAADRLLGRGSAGGSGDVQELTLGSNLTLTGTVLDSAAPGTGTVTTTGSPASGNLTKFSGATSIVNGDLSGDATTSGTLAVTLATPLKTRAFELIIGDNTNVISTGIYADLSVPVALTNFTITRCRLLADQSGSIVIDLWADTYANYPPTIADTIVASAPPTISSATKSEDATLTGWTTAIAGGKTIRINVNSCTSIKRCLLVLEGVAS